MQVVVRALGLFPSFLPWFVRSFVRLCVCVETWGGASSLYISSLRLPLPCLVSVLAVVSRIPALLPCQLTRGRLARRTRVHSTLSIVNYANISLKQLDEFSLVWFHSRWWTRCRVWWIDDLRLCLLCCVFCSFSINSLSQSDHNLTRFFVSSFRYADGWASWRIVACVSIILLLLLLLLCCELWVRVCLCGGEAI